ncbi:Gfo/Idh/MocA family oxidoreductase [Cryobacterium sp. 10S3]|uniref:Gfo/Idh/MocA family protein n=1 Tax=Cryobacterium sp. 10S3 TaxID=3048582 RepID=UPI002AC8E063|nr:Gfo/Idh/MocA family oxidoreductase [Cryobacterium sp. 10S3]MEB0287497.1 Gfo/Idh/MocA family oxidoreductase [Cryobacterium sp. 10S3]WPX13279.1 Gfo/Idh/MocA family oxidoreductase [Cryobacterium sp. 10S3]
MTVAQVRDGAIGLAILGAGMIVNDFLSVARDLPDFELIAIFGLESQRGPLDELASTHGIRTVYTDYEECLADPDVDAVYVGLPNHLHYAFARQALLAGKHVICEKPFTLNLSELRDLRAVATEQGLILIEAVTTQYLTNYRLIKEAIPSLGDLKLIQCNYSQYSSRYSAFRRGEVLPAFDPAKGGGALMDIGIYNIHFVVGLCGEPTSVHYTANIERGVDTSGILVLEYPTFKVVCVGAKDCGGPVRSLIQGDGGTIVMDGPPNVCESFTVLKPGEEPRQVDEKVHEHRMVEEFLAFSKMVRALDFEDRDARLAHSEAVLEVATVALDSAGIRLGA